MSTTNQQSMSMFEDIVKKVIMDMMSDNDSDSDDSISTIKITVPSKEELNPVKAERRRSSLSPKKTRRRRSKSRRSTGIKKDLSKISLVEEEDMLITGNDSGTTVFNEDRKTKSKGKKKKNKSKNRTKTRSISPLESGSRSPTSRKSPKAVYDRVTIVDPRGIMEEDSDESIVDTLRTSDHSFSSSMTGGSVTSKPGTIQFYEEMTSKLRPHLNSLCINHDCNKKLYTFDDNDRSTEEAVSQVNDFEAAFAPDKMRCLALVSHNDMKATMKDFVIKYKNVLKKFRLTGTQSTMKMLGEVFEGDDSVVFGPACNSGPLGGDAELVAMMATGQLGGILFFQDPMTAHPHQADIRCLVRQALVHNTVLATTPTTAMTIMEVFKMALEGSGRPELIPSFFYSLQSPTVEAYKINQKKAIASHAA
jgi:methylglyoxal synthase